MSAAGNNKSNNNNEGKGAERDKQEIGSTVRKGKCEIKLPQGDEDGEEEAAKLKDAKRSAE